MAETPTGLGVQLPPCAASAPPLSVQHTPSTTFPSPLFSLRSPSSTHTPCAWRGAPPSASRMPHTSTSWLQQPSYAPPTCSRGELAGARQTLPGRWIADWVWSWVSSGRSSLRYVRSRWLIHLSAIRRCSLRSSFSFCSLMSFFARVSLVWCKASSFSLPTLRRGACGVWHRWLRRAWRTEQLGVQLLPWGRIPARNR